ncbi:MAG: hypothetical protein M2R45_02581 [Verrucomicrobia subdivision 3 bacterium]|nr:hypothetical protein [Limisphaerales bacterium]MCS1416449.1 hypothetical protein [Limisphaerales bacterium]
MDDDDSMQMGFVQRRLPWVITVASFVLYLLTLNHWVTSESLGTVAKVTDWDWLPQTSNSLLYLVTLPVRWFPVQFQPIALNVLSALLGALTLGQLARSVALLPHDRTREQRQRERSDYSLLSLKTAWMPPLFACLVCGLQLTFWEESTALTGEILSVFVLACVIRCLLEFRLFQEDRWLYRMAFLYGFAIPSDWAFIGYFPLVVCSLIWMKGFPSFRPDFMGRMIVLGLIGLSAYLLLPLVILMQNSGAGSFVELLKLQVGSQKMYLANAPKTGALLLSLTSVLPVIVMGIRFSSSIGDVSVVGAMLSNFMFRAMHLLFLVACVWVAFDPAFSPRNISQTLPIDFITFYYLGALAVGYFSGYTLLVFRNSQSHSPRKMARENRFLNSVVSGLLWLGVICVPFGLLFKNLSVIRLSNGDQIRHFGELLVRHLPEERAIILADNDYSILLVKSVLAQQALKRDYTFIDTGSLQIGYYERQVRESLVSGWSDIFTQDNLPVQLDVISLFPVLAKVSGKYPIYYLISSFGHFFEVFYPHQKGLVTELVAYGEGEVEPPPISEADIEANQSFWQELSEKLSQLGEGVAKMDRTSRTLGKWCSREQNVWAVSLQRLGRLKEAKDGLERSLTWNPENTCAQVNLRQNEILSGSRQGQDGGLTQGNIQDVQKNYGTYERLLLANGPIDEPDFCMQLGNEFAQGGNYRQAAMNYKRAFVLAPANVEAKLLRANSLLAAGLPNAVLTQIAVVKAENTELTPVQKAELVRLEALGYYGVGNKAAAAGDTAQQKALFDVAEGLLKTALAADPNNEGFLETLSQVYLLTGRYEESLVLFDRRLAIRPDDLRLLQDKALAHIRIKQFQAAIALLNTVIEVDPANVYARLNRAIAQYRIGDHENAKIDYQTVAETVSEHHAIYYGLGKIAQAAGDTASAIQHFERYLELAPKDTDEYREVEETLKSLKGQ